MIFQTSTQRKRWMFSADALAALRAETNAAGARRLAARSADATPMSAAEELAVVRAFVAKTADLGESCYSGRARPRSRGAAFELQPLTAPRGRRFAGRHRVQ